MSYLEEAYHYTTNKKSLLETARHSKNIIVYKKLPYWSVLFMTIAIVGEIVERYGKKVGSELVLEYINEGKNGLRH